MSFAVGALVRTRGREWVVLPESEQDFLLLRPLGGTDEEIAGVHLGLEDVQSATLSLPTDEQLGDHRSGRLLRDAVRLGFRHSAGPFRSFGRIACDPRPYQLVPLLMALRQEPIRLLIADDVGIGKTIEAALIARELLDRGEIQRIAVLCPPHLAEQWQREFSQKFNLEFELVLAGTARRLEQGCAANQSLFEVYPHVIVSTDYIKSNTRREDFLRACPDFVIVDEAHTCAATAETGWGRHQRHQLLKGVAKDPNRHLLLVTATPHSGKDDAFRSLLSLLNPEFATLPDDLAGEANRKQRERLAAHLVQRRRADIEHYLDADTPFPQRQEAEETYKLHAEYLDLFRRALDYARETVQDTAGGAFHQRIRWWSVLALLRSLASSPAAAVDTLTSRSGSADADSEAEADEIGKRTVMDALDDTTSEGSDVAPGGDTGEGEEDAANRRQLREMGHLAEGLKGEKDAKLQRAKKLIKGLVDDGFNPIVFCRFIPTADYLAAELRGALPKKVAVEAVTGLLPPADREARVLGLAGQERRVLVCTDCLSEGINLQDSFDAVVHYDLAWNPTRHEQREGRVDRYGQKRKTVRVLTYYGTDNAIDGVVLEVLLRKHRKIRGSLGISVPVPLDTEKVMSAILHGALLRGEGGQLTLDLARDDQEELETQWEAAAQREKLSRTLFAQHSIRPEEVGAELEETRAAIGSGVDVERFVREAFAAHGAIVSGGDPTKIQLKETPPAVRDALRDHRDSDDLKVRFELPVDDGEIHLHRTHPIVEGLAGHVLDSTLDPVLAKSVARRAGVIRTRDVTTRTTVVLLRLRYHILTALKAGGERALLAEECRLVAFRASGANPEWLTDADAETLLAAAPGANVNPDQARHFLGRALGDIPSLMPAFEKLAYEDAARILAAHERVREAVRAKGLRHRVEPKLPVDVLGVYVYLPEGAA